MSQHTYEPLRLTIEQQIILEEEKYKKAFKADAEFQVLKDIRQTINHLKVKLSLHPPKKSTC